MNRRSHARRQLCALSMVILVLWSPVEVQTATGDSPLEVIRRATQQALAVLDEPAYRGPARRRERITAMWEVILPSFDEQEIAKRSLGPLWQGLNAEQRTRFTNLFSEFVKHSYSSTLDRHSTDAQFFFDAERVEGAYAEVSTRIVAPGQSSPFTVVYRLHQRDGRWQAYDVVAENVSLVRNYRAQFHRILSRSSFDGLLQTLADKLVELGVTERQP